MSPLPRVTKALGVDLHDAFLHELTLSPSSGELCLCLRAGDLERGYFDAALMAHNYEAVYWNLVRESSGRAVAHAGEGLVHG